MVHTVRRLETTILPEENGSSVHTVLSRRLQLSGTLLRRIKWLEDGILLNDQRVTTQHRVSSGQRLSVRLSDPIRRSQIMPTPGKIDIVYEDEDLVVLNKPSGMTVHPNPGHMDSSLGNHLLYYYDRCSIGADFHPVHRLDRQTSGLLLVAKHTYAQDQLCRQLHTNNFLREYDAICHGELTQEAFTIRLPIGRAVDSLMMRTVRPDGQDACTHGRVLSCRGGYSLLRLKLETGRTHQIRVHLAHMGHPLLGDFLYGQEEPEIISRLALHARSLSFLHPLSGERLSFSLPLPPEMAVLFPLTQDEEHQP